MSEFYFAVSRITCAQLCRATGIERCAPPALDTLADVLVRYLEALAQTSAAVAEAAGHETVELADAAAALERFGTLGMRVAPTDTSDVDEFQRWASGPAPARAAHVARIQKQAASALGAAQGAALAAQQASADTNEAAARAADRSAAEQQQLYQQERTARALADDIALAQPPEDRSADWLQSLVQKQIMMGHDKRYRHTVFGGGGGSSGSGDGTAGTDVANGGVSSPDSSGADAAAAAPEDRIAIGGGPSTLEEFYAAAISGINRQHVFPGADGPDAGVGAPVVVIGHAQDHGGPT